MVGGRFWRWAACLGLVATLTGACLDTAAVRQSAGAPPVVVTRDGSGGINHESVLDRPYVVLVSFDGFRPDYLDRLDTPSFDRLAEAGVTAEGLIPVFPSLTFPSHYSIATGLYPEHHGIVGNRFYDPARGEEFNFRGGDAARGGSWWEGEPLWVTAETQGMVAAAFFFPGTDAAIQDIRPTHWRPYDSAVPNAARVEQVLAWLSAPAEGRPHLVTLYFSMVDGAGHNLGPDAAAMGSAVGLADRMLGLLIDGIDRLPYGERVYLVVVSDHGMAPVDPDRQIELPALVNLSGVRAVPTGPGMSLYLNGGRGGLLLRDNLNARLDGARAYLRDELPAHLHFTASARVGDVVVVPEEGVLVGFRRDASPPVAMHGWDPTLRSMHGIFLARGPGIRPASRIAVFENIHIYPWLARLLRLRANEGIDGDEAVLIDAIGPPADR